MQKVITITSYTNIINNGNYVEDEYEKLNKYLEEGYVIIDKIPIIKQHSDDYMYAITFILEKDN